MSPAADSIAAGWPAAAPPDANLAWPAVNTAEADKVPIAPVSRIARWEIWPESIAVAIGDSSRANPFTNIMAAA